MNKGMGEKLINALLDKYERSSFFRTGGKPSRRILLKLYENGKGEFPAYDIEDSEGRIRVNECVQELAQKGLIRFEWMKGEENHILSKAWLDVESLEEAYRFANRQPRDTFLSAVEAELVRCRAALKAQWVNDYLRDACEYIRQKRKLPALIPEQAEERSALLRALEYIDANRDQELLKRVFSVRCFGDSKYFERMVEGRLLRILRRYVDCDEATPDEQLLGLIGIVQYPEPFEFCGALFLHTPDGKTLDFSGLRGGAAVYGQDVASARVTLPKDVQRILSIENKANYFDYISKHRQAQELVIYHGGPYSPSKKCFYRAIALASEGRPWYHWGDIDYGGFSMLARLRREIRADISPYRMNRGELALYAAFATAFPPEYARRLRELAERPELEDCAECLAYMLEHGVRLEQEALLE